jgi:hypothetical protein
LTVGQMASGERSTEMNFGPRFVRRFVDEHPTASAVITVVGMIAAVILVVSLIMQCNCGLEYRRTVRSIGEVGLIVLLAFWGFLGWAASHVGTKRPVLGGVLLSVLVLSIFAFIAAGSPVCDEQEEPVEPCHIPDPNDRPGR